MLNASNLNFTNIFLASVSKRDWKGTELQVREPDIKSLFQKPKNEIMADEIEGMAEGIAS